MSTSIFFKAAIAAGLAGVVWYLFKGHSGGGRDLWPALGFPYGPTGNLAAIPIRGQSPVIEGVHAPLLDWSGNKLTDENGNVLVDYSIVSPLGLPHNNSQLLVNFNVSGTKPS